MKKLFAPYNPEVPGDSLRIAQSEAGSAGFVEDPTDQPGVSQPVAGRRNLVREFPREHHDGLDRALTHLEQLQGGRQALGLKRWAEITEVVNEYNYSPAGTATVINGVTYYVVKANDPATGGRYQGFATITAFLVSVPSGATGVLQLGDLTLPVGQGITTSPAGINLQLATDDIRQLNCTASGPMSIAVFGYVTPMTATLPV